MEIALALVVIVALGATVAYSLRRQRRREQERRETELRPVKRLAFEDVTALGEELQRLDAELAGVELDEGGRADFQRALDVYEDAKAAGDAMTHPDDVRHVTQIVEDGRYAIACVRARAAGEPLPARRAPCFFDPRHGPSVADVLWAPPGGVERDVPACALDVERLSSGAEPDIRKVLSGSRRVPYFQAGPAYQPYAAGYFASYDAMTWMVAGLAIGSLGDFGGDYGFSGDSLGDLGGGGFDAGGSDGGGYDGGGFDGGGFDGGGFDGGGFDGGGGGF